MLVVFVRGLFGFAPAPRVVVCVLLASGAWCASCQSGAVLVRAALIACGCSPRRLFCPRCYASVVAFLWRLGSRLAGLDARPPFCRTVSRFRWYVTALGACSVGVVWLLPCGAAGPVLSFTCNVFWRFWPPPMLSLCAGFSWWLLRISFCIQLLLCRPCGSLRFVGLSFPALALFAMQAVPPAPPPHPTGWGWFCSTLWVLHARFALLLAPPRGSVARSLALIRCAVSAIFFLLEFLCRSGACIFVLAPLPAIACLGCDSSPLALIAGVAVIG